MRTFTYKIFPCLLLASLLSLVNLQAQSSTRFGLKAGVNVANLYTNDVESENAKIGFNGGLFLKLRVTDHFAFQPELLFSTQGTELNYDNSLVTGSVRYRMNYWQVPLLGVFNLVRFVNVHGGIYLASLTGVNVKNVTTGGTFNFEEEIDEDNFNSLDYGFSIGAGGDFDRVSIGLRYNYGLRNIGRERDILGGTIRFPDARNSVFQIYAGVSLF